MPHPVVTRPDFPRAFVWTKMQAEAGQPLDAIVRRKELERAASGGEFFWGIGNALGENLRRLVAREPEPAVLFSIMRSKPKRQDLEPDTLLFWTAYADMAGKIRSMPPHALVLSRGETANREKRRHYALVCRSAEPLRLARHGALDASHFRNLGSAAPRVGASQVTAVVEHEAPRSQQLDTALNDASSRAASLSTDGPTYEVNMRAELTQPYFVRLAKPLLVPEDIRQDIAGLPTAQMGIAEWLAFVATVRNGAEANTPRNIDPEDLFGSVSV